MQVLDNEAVRRLSWTDVMGALEAAFRARALNPRAFFMPERVAIGLEGKSYLTMPCADQEGWFGVKQVSVIPENPGRGLPSVQAWYTLFDPAGKPALACDAALLTRYRTSAASALAARYLVPENTRTLLVVGTGSLAPWMAEAHAQVRVYERLLVWGRDADKAEATAADVAKRLTMSSAEVEAVASLDSVVGEADVISVATTARAPLVKGDRLKPGQHLDLVGAFSPQMAELDPAGVARSSVYVDDLEASQSEAGDLIQAAAQGWSFEQVAGDLAALVTGEAERKGPDEITLFKSVGLALEDLAVAKLLAS